MSISAILPNWSNANMGSFYKNLPIPEFKTFAKFGGLNKNKDINQIKSLILKSNSMLEVGAGYGRVVKEALNINPALNLTAIERSKSLCKYLNSKFSNKATIVSSNVFEYNPNKYFDLITIMWSSITEFNPREQNKLIKKLSEMLSPTGHIVIETIDSSASHSYVKEKKGQNYIVESTHGTVYLYAPMFNEIMNYFYNSSLELKSTIKYKANNKPRKIYIGSRKLATNFVL